MNLFFQFVKVLKRYFHPARSSFLFVISFAIALNLIFGVLFYYFEKDVQTELTLIDSIWWAMVTMTTVGYGDFYAQTSIGRFVISYPTMVIGIGIIGYLVGVVAEFILDFSSKKRRGLMEIYYKNHIIICNYPGIEKILNIVSELKACEEYNKSKIVLVTEKLDELPEELKKHGIEFVYGSPTNETVLTTAGVLDSSGVIVLSEDIQNSISDERNYTVGSLIELMEKQHNKPIKTVVEVVKKENYRLIKRTEADGIVSTDGLSAMLLSQEFDTPGINSVFTQLLTNKEGSQLYLHKSKLVGHKLYDLQKGALEHETNMQIVGIIKGDESILNPDKSIIIENGDRIVMLAENKREIEKVENSILNKK